MIVSYNQDCLYLPNKDTIYNKRITGLLKSDNSIFGMESQISCEIIVDKYQGITTKNPMEIIKPIDSLLELRDYTDYSVSSEHTDSIDFSDSTDSGDTTESVESEKYAQNYNNFSYKTKKYKKNKKTVATNSKCFNYNGGFTTEFDKNSSFINMLVNRRIRTCETGPSYHIAVFVQNFGIENKFTNWAFGKLAIGENSERMRFGNDRLSTHAEMDALKKLYGLIRVQKCKKQKMDLVVIRVNKSGNLCESAPCYHCTKELEKTKVVNINRLYFSRADGSITCVKFSEWVKNENLHISKGWRWMNCETK